MALGRGNNIFRIRAKDRLIGEKLASQNEFQNTKGKPLKIPQFNFTISLENKVKSMFGPPHYATRARRIEIITQRLIEDLTVEYDRMVAKLGDDSEGFTKQWQELIRSMELVEINDLIDKHNRYYPIEANLQIDPDSGAPLVGSVLWEPVPQITIEGLLDRFPADMTSIL